MPIAVRVHARSRARARRLRGPGRAALVEDSLAGVEAGHAGTFGCTVDVDPAGRADALSAHGASAVVPDLAELSRAS